MRSICARGDGSSAQWWSIDRSVPIALAGRRFGGANATCPGHGGDSPLCGPRCAMRDAAPGALVTRMTR
jgi:hypothetical protein